MDTSQAFEQEREETILIDKSGMNRTSALFVNCFFTFTSTSCVSMSQFPALSHDIPLGMRADCFPIKGHG